MKKRCIDGRGKNLGPLVQRLMLFGGSPASHARKFILIFFIIPDLLIFKVSIKKSSAQVLFTNLPNFPLWEEKGAGHAPRSVDM